MILLKFIRLNIFVVLFHTFLSSVFSNEIQFISTDHGYSFHDQDRRINFDALGNISSYQFITKKYTKNFMDSGHHLVESKKAINSRDLGIRFGFLERDEKIFSPEKATVLSKDPYKIQFISKDLDESSSAKGLIISKIYTFLPNYQIELKVDLTNSNDQAITSLYTSSKKGNVPGFVFGMTVALDTWASYSLGSKSEIEALSPEEEAQTFHQRVIEKFIEGGWEFMGIVLLCLILGLAISIERIINLNMTNAKI